MPPDNTFHDSLRAIKYITRTMQYNGITVAGLPAFPLLTRVAIMQFEVDAAISFISLSSSMITFTAQSGLVLMKDQGQNANLDNAEGVLISHCSQVSSSAIVTVPIVRANSLSFPREGTYRLDKGSALALYSCGVIDALILGTATVIWEPLT